MTPMKNEQLLRLERHDGVGLSICIGELYQLREVTFRFEMFDNSPDLPSRQVLLRQIDDERDSGQDWDRSVDHFFRFT